ncbi:pathogenesis-related thaumatin-like protein 3.5 [Prosopis cineraria]|uniref:pathogenesis-related thaumatin-like protein 3.5 n=1 Tax=Prosopis cineraria TaxID=364024 RepID=UPI0024106F5C|nr:pathogenesis-related thaumatin-like protein 3.5 [Prosopis cineraria]
MPFSKLPTFLLLLFTSSTSSYCITFTITNNCTTTIWPATLSGSGLPELLLTGFWLEAGRSVKLTSGPKWSGRIWGRTGCEFDGNGNGKCQTGDCGGKLECKGNGAAPPASLFEITLGGGTDQDFYDVSLVDGYNLPMLAVPAGVYGASACNSTGCISNLNRGCPRELQVKSGGVVGCESTCEAFGSDQYCCRGQHANPTTCHASYYSANFKKAFPTAYSYAFDDISSTFTCKANVYHLIFWPPASSTRITKPTSERNGKAQQVGFSNTDLFPYSSPITLSVAALIIFGASAATWSFI